MTRYVIGPDVAIELAKNRVRPDAENQLLAPTLIRSQDPVPPISGSAQS